MNRNYFYWILLLVILSIFFIGFSMWETTKPLHIPTQQAIVPMSPFQHYISGAGIIEASTDNISIGTSLNRIVTHVFVKVGNRVKKGDPLFMMDNRDLQADLEARKIGYDIALAQLKKLESFPRKEDILAAEAALANTQIALQQAGNQYEKVQALTDTRALSEQEIQRRYSLYAQAKGNVQEREAALNKIKQGTWEPDLAIAQLEAKQAWANIEKVKTDIDQTTVRSPIDGTVLQVKIHEGEYPASFHLKGPLLIVGDTDELYVKVSINQFDASHFKENAAAVGFLRGNARIKFLLTFVRIEPLLVNKQNLTNEITEKVDTRVLQVIYKIKPENHTLFVGQQMDVFIEDTKI